MATTLFFLAVSPGVARPVRHVRTMTNVDWTFAGIGGVGGGSGTIVLTGVNGEVKRAFLYWHGIDDDGRYDNETIQFNGFSVTGVALGDATTNCWGDEGSSRAFRADVTKLVSGNGSYHLTGLSAGGGHSANGASLVVIFDDGVATNNVNLAFFEGNDSNRSDGFPGEDDGWHARLFPVVFSGGVARAVLHVADGQSFRDNSLTFHTDAGYRTFVDDATLWDGRSVPSAGSSRAKNGSLWDIHSFDITDAFGDKEGRVGLGMTGQLSRSDCLGLVLALIETPVKINVHAIEVTQAIQQEQKIKEMETDLGGDREPPVPLVAGKLAALRVIFADVDAVTKLRLRIEVPGRPAIDRRINLVPACNAAKRRLKSKGCRSVDVRFIPPEGEWNARVKIFNLEGDELESYDLPFKSRKAEPLVLSAVRICDSKSGDNWLCSNNFLTRLRQISSLTREISPTPSLTVVNSGDTVRRDIMTYDANRDGKIDSRESEAWWDAVVGDVSNLYSFFDGVKDFLGLEDRRYYGIIRDAVPSHGLLGVAAGIPSHGAMSVSTARDLGVDVSADTVAHEIFHTMNRRHTNTKAPVGGAEPPRGTSPKPPGCSLAPDGATDWPFADNRIRSGKKRLEVGFDPLTLRAFDPNITFDVMSYCVPVWISPHTYTNLLNGAFFSGPSKSTDASEQGEFWRVAGTLRGESDGIDFLPLFRLDTRAKVDSGTGAYSIEVRDAADALLFVRAFDPVAPVARLEAGREEMTSSPTFVELLPVQSSAARIVFIDPEGTEIDRIEIEGASPVVDIVFPGGGETLSGQETLTWAIVDMDSTDHASLVQYSPDGGALGSWKTLALDLEETSLVVDFDSLPGADGTGVLRVVSSDGVNSGVSVSSPFSVGRKTPTVRIFAPTEAESLGVGRALILEGFASDPEDGTLDGDAVVWSSNRDGVLGTGSDLLVDGLSPGDHEVTLTATDSDENTVSTTVRMKVAAAPPVLDVNVEGEDAPLPSCVRVTIAVESDLDLSSVDYSLDGGDSYTSVDPASLPLSFTVPGEGLFHLVVRAFDQADQQDAFDTRFFIEEACAQDNAAPIAVAGEDIVAECEEGKAQVEVDGSASSDPDGDAISCAWESAECEIADPAACRTTAICSLGQSSLQLVVSDGELESSPDALLVNVEDNVAPTGEILFPVAGQCLAPPVTLLDSFVDRCESNLQRKYEPGPGPTYTDEGSLAIMLTAVDSSENASSDTVSFIVDGTAPEVTLTPPGAMQEVPRLEPIASFLSTHDADAAPGGVVAERVLIDGCVVLDGTSYGNGDGLLVDESVEVAMPLLCRAFHACGQSLFENPVLSAEADDCAGNTGTSSLVFLGRYVVDATVCSDSPE